MSEAASIVHINKIAAAGRQLDAAIRMFFGKEDDLAIHTLGYAAFRILRDVTEKRGRNFTADLLRNGVFAIAKRYSDGVLSEAELKLIAHTPLMDAIRKIGDDIKGQGDKFDRSTINVLMNKRSEQRAWPSKAANFLKHADRDSEDFLAINDLNNESILIGASISYLQLMQNATPEMRAYMAYWSVKNEEEHDLPNDECGLAARLKNVKQDDWPDLCLAFLVENKAPVQS
jgi:hypothetical protein